jgi:serine protease Do
VAEALAKAGLADQAKEAALKIDAPGARSQALRVVAEALAKAGLADQAKEMASQATDAALQEGSELSNKARSIVMRSLVEVLLSVGLIEDSREVASRITDDQERSGALASVAGALARAHKFQVAREVAESCDLPASKLEAFTTILCEYTKITKPELAKVLDELEKSSNDSE